VEQKVDRETAEREFEKFVEAMDLDVDKDGMDDEDRKAFDNAKRKFIRAVMRGRLSLNENGEPVVQPTDGEPITFHEPRGDTFMATDQKKQGHDVAKNIAMMAAMTGEPPKRFANMPNRDLDICTTVQLLFLG